MARKATYTLDDFAKDWRGENGQPILSYARPWLAMYRRQCAWNDRTAKLLANTTPWDERPVPTVDWSPAGMRAWARATMTDYPVHQAPEARAFRKALAAIPDSARDASAPSPHRGACAECLYTAQMASVTRTATSRYGQEGQFTARFDVPARLAPVPHTCGMVPAQATTPTRTRRRAA